MTTAPFIYFDSVSSFGITRDGTVHLTLTAMCSQTEQVPVVHLRMGRNATAQLRKALEKIDLSARAVVSNERN